MTNDKKTTWLGNLEALLYIMGAGILTFAGTPAGQAIIATLSSNPTTLGITLAVLAMIKAAQGYFTNKIDASKT